MLLDLLAPALARGVVALTTCPTCRRAVPVMGAVGKGRALDTFGPGYLCPGHAVRLTSQ